VEILVNHLTRMSAPRICIAGIDTANQVHVRPITPPTDLLTRALLTEQGGPLAAGAVIDIGRSIPVGSPPETEDHRISSAELELVRMVDGETYLDALAGMAKPDLETAFGPDLERHDWKYTVDVGEGEGSLAVVEAHSRPDLTVDDYGKLTLRFNDPERPAYLSVTDVRFFGPDHKTVKDELVVDVRRRLRRGVRVFVMFGLSRPWAPDGEEERHWLQANSLCLEDRPIGPEP
jgi:putative nucleic acid modification protein with dual OB domain